MKLPISQKHLKTTPPSDDENLLATINERLADPPPHDASIELPMLFVTGSPRSGTTLLAQSIVGYFDLGFVDNLAAKFWATPSIGIGLSRMVFGRDRAPEAKSDYGRTVGSNIHGFHYFWMNRLKLNWVDDLFQDPVERGVDWDEIHRVLGGLQQADGRSFLMKGYYPSYFMRRFCEFGRNVVFVRIKRNPIDQAASIRQARLQELGREDIWWSMQPPEIYDLIEKSPADQIAGQILGLNRHFERQAADPAVQCIDIDYDDLCGNPAKELGRIGDFVHDCTGRSLTVRGALPSIAKSNRDTVDRVFQAAMENALTAFQ